MDINELREWVASYRESREFLKSYKQRHFRRGTPVRVNHPKYRGTGVAMDPETGRPDRITVKLANGNEWTYEFECVQPLEPTPTDE